METIVIDDTYETEQPFPGASTELRLMTYQERFTFQQTDGILQDGEALVRWARKLWVEGKKQPDEHGQTIKKFDHIKDMTKVNLGHLMFALAMCYKESQFKDDERKK